VTSSSGSSPAAAVSANREIGDEDFIVDDHGTRREQQPVRVPVAIDPAEFAELGDDPAVRVQRDDFIGLVGAHPQ